MFVQVETHLNLFVRGMSLHHNPLNLVDVGKSVPAEVEVRRTF
jgi:hypothetical protein